MTINYIVDIFVTYSTVCLCDDLCVIMLIAVMTTAGGLFDYHLSLYSNTFQLHFFFST